MIRNYFLIATRNFLRNKVFSLINILSLAIGISASLVIYLIVHHEFSYEKFWQNKDRLFRVVSNMHFPDQDFKNSGVPGPLPPAMRAELPGIEESSVFWIDQNMNVSIEHEGAEKKIFRRQPNVVYADNHYFKLLPYEWLAGSSNTALAEPNKVVLTESRAKLYFPNASVTDAIGKTIVYNDTVKAVVSGIVKNRTEVTDFTFEEFVSLSTFEESLRKNNYWDQWGSISSSSQFLVQLQPGVSAKKIEGQFPAFRKKHAEKNDYLEMDHALQPLVDIHFNQDYDNFNQRQGHKPTLFGLLAVAAFLLLLGCINFINLTTAQSTRRAKEIGIRKTMGSSKTHLFIQFMMETILLTLVASTLSIALTPWILKIFSNYIPTGLHFNIQEQPDVLLFCLILILGVSLLAGIYPAMVLTQCKPVSVLKNQAYTNTSTSRRAFVRKSLTVSQFVIAQFFIIATVIVGKQIRFSLNQDLGFRKDAIIFFSTPFNYRNPDNKQFILQEKLRAIPEIQRISLAGTPPASQNLSIRTMKFIKDGKEMETTIEIKQADTNYIHLYNLKLVAGRNLQQSDTMKEYLVNEFYTRFLGFKHPEEIIGKQLNGNIPVVGVLADIHTKSMHQAIQPLAYTCEAKEHTSFHIAFNPLVENTDSWKTGIAKIEAAWKEVYPDEPFNYSFFDESIAAFYKKEQDIANLLNWCTGLSVFISSLGLLGLVMYTTNQRTKEIGVRKVLGATVIQIVSLISKDFIQLVILAFVIVVPLAWWAMHDWLQNFAYRTSISWWIFLVGGMLMTLIAFFVLSFQTIRAALANPVKSLRTE